MSKIDYTWNTSKPLTIDVYTTRRNESKYLTLRYWDGADWYSITRASRRDGIPGIPFTWPVLSRTKRPSWVVANPRGIGLRKVTAWSDEIQWGVPFREYDEKEVLSWLVKEGKLPATWKTCFQEQMRNPQAKTSSTLSVPPTRKFMVLDSSNVPFYSALGPLCKNFDGMTLDFIKDIPELGQVMLKQPTNGVVFLDYQNVKELF